MRPTLDFVEMRSTLTAQDNARRTYLRAAEFRCGEVSGWEGWGLYKPHATDDAPDGVGAYWGDAPNVENSSSWEVNRSSLKNSPDYENQ